MNYLNIPAPLGYYTYMGFYRLLGVSIHLPPGTYDEYYTYANLLKTNVYTVFRGLLLDFNIVGSIFLALLSGWVSGIFYYCLIKSKSTILIVLYITFVGWCYQSFMVSLLMYPSILAYMLVLYLVLKLNRIKFI